ncbi:MAG: glycosyltransferase family 2 protein, partial [Rickettsiales bacterium]|nr:glycosyltransferase family 2 protein [Rickettsiales bacterium]
MTDRGDIVLSVVSPVYKAEAFLREFHERMSKAAQALTPDYEIIYVHDGSPDASLAQLMALYEADERVVVIDLSRNFGQHKAIYTGLMHARGQLVYVLDGDLEDLPEWLQAFHQVMQDKDADVVMGAQVTRQGSFSKRWMGVVFYAMMAHVFRVNVVKNIVTARLMTRRYVQTLIAHKEQEFELSVVGSHIGFTRVVVPVQRHGRQGSGYHFMKRVRFMVNYIASSTTEPLHWIMPVGWACVVLGGVLALDALGGKGPARAAWLLSSVWLVGGFLLVSLGGVAVYVGKVFHEVRGRPPTIIRRIYS